MFNNKKSKRGFSLVELMVVVAIMGTLAAIAIPAYNEYRKSAKKSAYKADLTSLHKGWLAFGVEIDSFCERNTRPKGSSITNVGMQSLISSKLYGTTPNKQNFIGFSASAADCLVDHDSDDSTALMVVASAGDPMGLGINVADAAATKDDQCAVDVDTYKMGVFGHISGIKYIGYQIQESGVVTERSEVDEDSSGQVSSANIETTCV